MPKVKDYKKHLLVQLQNPEEAAAYLNAALNDNDPHAFLLALSDIAEVKGGISWLSEFCADPHMWRFTQKLSTAMMRKTR